MIFCATEHYYSLFTFSWPQFESGSLCNGGMLILRIYLVVDGMPIEMYGESWIAGLFLLAMTSCCIWLDSKQRKESNSTYCAFMA